MADDAFKKEADRILSENMPTPSGEGLIALHELYTSLREAGFTQYESLWLIGYTFTDGSGKGFEDI
jgi:hypothetical protein